MHTTYSQIIDQKRCLNDTHEGRGKGRDNHQPFAMHKSKRGRKTSMSERRGFLKHCRLITPHITRSLCMQLQSMMKYVTDWLPPSHPTNSTTSQIALIFRLFLRFFRIILHFCLHICILHTFIHFRLHFLPLYFALKPSFFAFFFYFQRFSSIFLSFCTFPPFSALTFHFSHRTFHFFRVLD